MKALKNSVYSHYKVAKEFNAIILGHIQNYNGSKKEQLQSFLNDLSRGGCICGMISEFIYHSDCKDFYIEHLDDLEDFKSDLEDSLGEPIQNRFESPHYTFMCWLCFEEYCFEIYRRVFEK